MLPCVSVCVQGPTWVAKAQKTAHKYYQQETGSQTTLNSESFCTVSRHPWFCRRHSLAGHQQASCLLYRGRNTREHFGSGTSTPVLPEECPTGRGADREADTPLIAGSWGRDEASRPQWKILVTQAGMYVSVKCLSS